MVPLYFKEAFHPRFPDFLLTRVLADVHFEPITPDLPIYASYFERAVIDTGAGYLVIPNKVHRTQNLKVYQELSKKPYRILSASGPPVLQRFAEVGIHFLIRKSDGTFDFWPKQFVRVKAYLLDADTRPKEKVLFGLDALLEKDNSFLQARDNS